MQCENSEEPTISWPFSVSFWIRVLTTLGLGTSVVVLHQEYPGAVAMLAALAWMYCNFNAAFSDEYRRQKRKKQHMQ